MFGQNLLRRAEPLARLELLEFVYQSVIRQQVAGTVEGLWMPFTKDLPLEVKKQLRYQKDERLSGIGYEYKEGKNGTDRKENIHLQLDKQRLLRDLAKQTGESLVINLVDAGLALIESVPLIISDYIEEIEARLQQPNFRKEVMQGLPFWLLRLLHYLEGCEPDQIMAQWHTDKGCFTPHLYESHPGLQYLSAAGKWVDISFAHDRSVVLPGIRMQHRSKCAVTAVCHRVIATEETARNGRYSAVCFVDSNYSHYFNKEKYGSQQDWQAERPGINYNMTFEELDRHFLCA